MRNDVIVQKLLSYAKKILLYCDGMDQESFFSDSKLVEACVFNLSQMGELCKSVDRQFAADHPQIPWNELYGLRNRIVHDYEGVNLSLVWQIIFEDLPDTVAELEKLLQAETAAPGPSPSFTETSSSK